MRNTLKRGRYDGLEPMLAAFAGHTCQRYPLFHCRVCAEVEGYRTAPYPQRESMGSIDTAIGWGWGG